MKIRKTTHDDIQTLSRLMAEVQRLHVAHEPEIFSPPEGDNFGVGFFEKMLAEPGNQIFIAEVAGDAAGYILLSIQEREADIFGLYRRFMQLDHIGVDAVYRGQGIGKALMEKAKAVARAEKITNLTLGTWGFNKNAQAFFRSQGFETMMLNMRYKIE